MSDAITKNRLKPILERSVEGVPYYWYGVVEPFAGSLWSELCVSKSQADEIAKNLGGRVVIVAARILEDENGEQIEPANWLTPSETET